MLRFLHHAQAKIKVILVLFSIGTETFIVVTMKIGLLIIGNEILEGKIADLNTRSLAVFLRELNLELTTSLVVGDLESTIHQGLKTMFTQCDVVITSGGLGPTRDDLTKEAIASYLGRGISFSESSYQVALKNYQRFNRPFEDKNHGYCFLPEGFLPLENSTGFAPCLYTEESGKHLLCGPGVPREFKSMLTDHFEKLILKHFPKSNLLIETFTARTKRIPEEKIFGEVDPTLWNKLANYGTVSSLPTVMGVDIGIKIIAHDPHEMSLKKNELMDIFQKSPVAPAIWQYGLIPLEDYIVGLANKKNITYGFAESCTGGLCSHRVTNIAGSSQTFLGSIICYSEAIKSSSLEVNPQTLAKFGVVSAETAAEMSSGLAKIFGLDVAISITGVAGPGGGTLEKPVGTAFVGLTCRGQTITHRLQLFGDREQLKLRFSQAVLFYLLEELEKFA
jgi:nicotinamide-nucleotide amidase